MPADWRGKTNLAYYHKVGTFIFHASSKLHIQLHHQLILLIFSFKSMRLNREANIRVKPRGQLIDLNTRVFFRAEFFNWQTWKIHIFGFKLESFLIKKNNPSLKDRKSLVYRLKYKQRTFIINFFYHLKQPLNQNLHLLQSWKSI